jgi:hypothetical protein
LPDYQGTFVRGVDTPNKEGTTGSLEKRKSPVDKKENVEVGSTQDYALLSHTHSYKKPEIGVVIPSVEPSGGISATPVTVSTGKASTCNKYQSEFETRPVNTFVYWLIKTTLD